MALPDELSFPVAASLGCRYATAYRAVVQQGAGARDEWVAVHGCGGVGLSAIQIAVAPGRASSPSTCRLRRWLWHPSSALK